MNKELAGFEFRSNPETFVAGGTITLRSEYLAGARNWRAPEAREMVVVFTGTVAAPAGAGGANGVDFPKLFNNFHLRSNGIDQIFVSGASLLHIQNIEVPQVEPPADVAQNTTNASYVGIMVIPFELPRNHRQRDTAVPLTDFLDAGEFTITLSSVMPTGWPVAPAADWRIQCFCRIREGRDRETKMARRIREVVMVNTDFTYDIGGFLRTALISSVRTDTGYSSLAGITLLNSTTLGWPPSYQAFRLQQQYQRQRFFPRTTDQIVQTTPGAIAVVFPEQDQKVGRQVMTRQLHIDITNASVPASARIITDVIVPADPRSLARTLGYDNAATAAAAIATDGVIVGGSGNHTARNFLPPLAKVLPTRIRAGGAKRPQQGSDIPST